MSDAACIIRLPLDDTLSVLRVLAAREKRLEHRPLRLFELEEQRIIVVAADEEQDPGAGSDASDADDLPRGVHVSVALEEVAPVSRQGAPVGADHPSHDILEVISLPHPAARPRSA